MPNLYILQGPAASGKTTWAAKWKAERPHHRIVIGSDNFVEAISHILLGHDVAVDLEGDEAIPKWAHVPSSQVLTFPMDISDA